MHPSSVAVWSSGSAPAQPLVRLELGVLVPTVEPAVLALLVADDADEALSPVVIPPAELDPAEPPLVPLVPEPDVLAPDVIAPEVLAPVLLVPPVPPADGLALAATPGPFDVGYGLADTPWLVPIVPVPVPVGVAEPAVELGPLVV